MKPFPKCYLDEVVETQGELFDCFNRRFPGCDTAHFITSYMISRTRFYIDSSQAYVVTMNAETLMNWFLEHDKYEPIEGETIRGFRPNWIGRFYALYQWSQALSSAETLAVVPLDYLLRAYAGLHDLDLKLAVEKVARLISG